MRIQILIFFLCFLVFKLIAQNEGIKILKVDIDSVTKTTIVHFDNSLGIIFPETYAQDLFASNINWRNKHFITLDSVFIKKINSVFIDQYCLARQIFIDKKWAEDKLYIIENETKKEFRLAEKYYKNQVFLLHKFCLINQNKLASKYKQYIGFINKNGETMVYINVLNFEDDTSNLKASFAKEWIEGCGEWFERNTEKYYFNVNKNKLSMNED